MYFEFQQQGSLMKFLDYVQHGLDSLVRKSSKMATKHQEENIMFMNCTVRINVLQPGLQTEVARIILGSIKVVRICTMEEDGTMKVSGMCDPDVLLRTVGKLRKKAELCWFQYGKCSSYLFGPSGEVPRSQLRSSSNRPARANDQAAKTGNVTETTAKVPTLNADGVSHCSLM